MKIGQKASTLALTLLAAASLIACGNTQGGDSTGSAGTSTDSVNTDPVTVEWWVPYAETDRTMTYVKDVAAAYHAAHENVTINITSKGGYTNDYGGAAKAVSDALTGGNTPTMTTTYGTYVAAWRAAAPEAVADVTAHGQALEKDADFNKQYLAVEKQQYGDKYYSLPYSKSGEVTQYNKELFAAVGTDIPGRPAEANPNLSAPAYPALPAATTKKAYDASKLSTMDGMMEIARQIKADYPSIPWGQRYTSDDKSTGYVSTNGYLKAIPVIYEDPTNLFISMLKSQNIQDIDLNGKGTGKTPFLTSDKAKATAIQLKKWSNEGLIATKNQLPIRNNHGGRAYPSTYVGNQTAAIMITSTANGPYDAVEGFSMGFHAVPKWNEASELRVVSQGPSIAFFNHTNKNELKAALDFYDFLTNGVNSATLAKQTYYFPTRTSSLEDEVLKAGVEQASKGVTYTDTIDTKKSCYLGEILNSNKELTEGANYYMSPVNELSANIRSACGNIVTKLFDDQAATTDEAIAALVNTVFDEAKSTIYA